MPVVQLKLINTCAAGTMNAGTVIDKGDMQRVMDQHQKNQFAQDVPFIKGDTKSEDDKSDGTGVFDPGNVHSQVSLTVATSADSRLLLAISP